MSTLGAPAGGRNWRIGGNLVSGSFAVYVVSLTGLRSGIGSTSRWMFSRGSVLGMGVLLQSFAVEGSRLPAGALTVFRGGRAPACLSVRQIHGKSSRSTTVRQRAHVSCQDSSKPSLSRTRRCAAFDNLLEQRQVLSIGSSHRRRHEGRDPS